MFYVIMFGCHKVDVWKYDVYVHGWFIKEHKNATCIMNATEECL